MLEDFEIQKLQKYALSYMEVHTKMERMEVLIEQLKKEKNDLINELEYTRQLESQFTADMIEKYGSKILNSKELKDAVTSVIRP